MPFDTGYGIIKGYLEERAESRAEGNPVEVFLDGHGDFHSLIDASFDSTDENAEWSQAVQSGANAIKVLRARAKIAWLAACRRDLREQYACGPRVTARKRSDHKRFAANSDVQAVRGMELFKKSALGG